MYSCCTRKDTRTRAVHCLRRSITIISREFGMAFKILHTRTSETLAVKITNSSHESDKNVGSQAKRWPSVYPRYPSLDIHLLILPTR